MVVSNSDQDVPPRMLDLLKQYLCWSQEKVHSQPSIDILAEDPASSSNSKDVPRKKVNPARARRSKLRFEEFIKKKVTGAPVQYRLAKLCSCSSHQTACHRAPFGWKDRLGAMTKQSSNTAGWIGSNQECYVHFQIQWTGYRVFADQDLPRECCYDPCHESKNMSPQCWPPMHSGTETSWWS